MGELSTTETAKILGCVVRHVRWLVANGYLRGKLVGARCILISEASVKAHKRKYPNGIGPGRNPAKRKTS